MAIQIPNPGTGNGASGDNEFVLWTKVKDNFNDQTNAASKLVATAAGQVPLAQDTFNAAFSTPLTRLTTGDANNLTVGSAVYAESAVLNLPPSGLGGTQATWIVYTLQAYFSNSGTQPARQIAMTYVHGLQNYMMSRVKDVVNGWSAWMPLNQSIHSYRTTTATAPNVTIDNKGVFMRSTSIAYTNINTTKDSNGFIKAASPIVKVFADKVELNGEAVDQDVSYKKNGVGDYTITTVSGLSTDGWYIELPKDMNGNPKVAVTLSEVDGVISLKSYKRIFSMETFTFEPDLDNPLDIPDTRWIDLRLNEIPVEMPDDTQMEV